MAKQSCKLRQRNRLFRRVDNGFDLCFKAHSFDVSPKHTNAAYDCLHRQGVPTHVDTQRVDQAGNRSRRNRHNSSAPHRSGPRRRDRPNVAGTASLKAHAAARGLLTGCAVNANLFRQDAAFRDLLAQQCSILVPENCMKLNQFRPTPDAYDFADADALVAFAQTHGIKLRGHNFVWHEALPTWFAATVTKANARKFLIDHITTVATRYKGKIHSWDVVNEAIWIKDGRPDGLRSSSPWFQMLGPDYLDLAFKTARRADPKALLTYNEYGIEYDTEDERRSAPPPSPSSAA